MHTHDLTAWLHDHTFGQDRVRLAERRTLMVLALTAATMVLEIAGGLAFRSMALLADGLHMGSHAMALGISVLAYGYVRRYATDRRFSFGTGKVNALAGFASAVLLAVFAVSIAAQCLDRLVSPSAIDFGPATGVAILGLVVNLASAMILAGRHHGHEHEAVGHDHNLRGAYLHVLADAATSLLAIAALVGARFSNWFWLDPAVGLIGALLVGRWALGLIRDTTAVLLDRQPSEPVLRRVRGAIEAGHGGDRVADLHVWSVGPEIYAAAITIVSARPRSPEEYKMRLPRDLAIVHATVEVHSCT